MRTTIHCDDEALSRHADGTPATVELAAHIAACQHCSEELAAQRHIATALRTAEVWVDEAPALAERSRIAEIAALSRRITREDEEACQVCDEILTGPAPWWRMRYRNGGAMPTAGVVRELLERMRHLLAQSPSKALTVTALAIEIAAELEPPRYPQSFILTLRGQALRDHAFVLGFMGRFPEALETADKAEQLLLRTAASEYELARLHLVRASIYRSIDRIDEAIVLARESAETFLRFGDGKRFVDARVTEAAYLFQSGSVVPALNIWESIVDDPAVTCDLTRIGIIHNIGLCYRELGELDEATERFSTAMREIGRAHV